MVDPRDFGKYLKQLRKERQLTTRQVEAYADVSNSYLSLLERGKRRPSPDILKKLASVYKVSYAELMKAAGYLDTDSIHETSAIYEPLPPNAIPVGETVKIPVLGVIRCGEPMYAEQNILGWEEVPARDVKDGEYFFLQVTGDSMTGSRIYPGDLVLVRRQPQVENGQIAVVLVNREEATLKRVKYMEEAVILYPDNPKYQPQIYKADEVKIIGLVVEVKFKP